MKTQEQFLFLWLLLLVKVSFSQNETSKWYFGSQAGLDFMTSPPTILVNSSMATQEGSSSIADGAGNLLFYTDGSTVWDKTHNVMANGTGLFGHNSSSQSAMIARQPGSTTLYYVFTQDGMNSNGFFSYSIVDMTLAAGMGSVTTKNVLLHNPCPEKLTATTHCNGNDIWIVAHEWESNKFLSYLLTSTGLNTTAVVSSVGTIHSNTLTNNNNGIQGCMKLSPNGKRLAVAISGTSSIAGYELYDFDNSTGVVSNFLLLGNNNYAYGVEFSPDGSKLYGANIVLPTRIYQWDLCAGSASNIASSKQTIWPGTTGTWKCSMQLAKDGKIYVATSGSNSLGVISDPNQAGTLCNFSATGQSIAPKLSQLGVPNMITSKLKSPLAPFTFTVNCQQVNFTGIAGTNTILSNCSAATYSATTLQWVLGDLASGPNNLSNLANPSHFYPGPGTYTAMLLIYHNCYTDTIRQVINITAASPTFAITGPTVICKGETATLTAGGAFSYSWNTNSSSASIVVSPTLSAQYSVTATNTLNGCTYTKTLSLTVNKCIGLVENNVLERISIYPNPTPGNFFIECEKALRISVFNQLGELILSRDISSHKNTIDIDSYSDGLYFIRMSDGENSKVMKFVKCD